MVEVREIIKGLIKTDITILMSSHLLYEVQEVCDKVAIIDRGVLLTYDSVANLSAGHELTVTINTLEPITPPEFKAIEALHGITSVKRHRNARAQSELQRGSGSTVQSAARDSKHGCQSRFLHAAARGRRRLSATRA